MAVTNFFDAVVGTLNLTVGKVVVAKTARSKLSYLRSLSFLKKIADMCIIDDNQACYDQLKEVYKPNMEELSSHPVHLLSQDYNLMPSALIPYCAFGIEMKNLGAKINNFSRPLCTAFSPALLEGELCYELDIDKIGGQVSRGLYGGLVLLLDVTLDRSIGVGKNKDFTVNLPITQSRQYSTQLEIEKRSTSETLTMEPTFYVHTIQPFSFVPNNLDFNQYIMTSIKHMVGSDNFLALPDDKKHCSTTSSERCKQERFLEDLDKICGCIPFGNTLIEDKISNKVKHFFFFCSSAYFLSGVLQSSRSGVLQRADHQLQLPAHMHWAVC